MEDKHSSEGVERVQELKRGRRQEKKRAGTMVMVAFFVFVLCSQETCQQKREVSVCGKQDGRKDRLEKIRLTRILDRLTRQQVTCLVPTDT